MASADVRDELLCSICLNIYTDPVMLRCGHNFCRVCIDQVLNTQDRAGAYSCPECREEFRKRPALRRNIALQNVAERLLSTHQEKITGICCTYCIHSPVPAVRSCLMCEASLCDNHLKVHSKGAEHVLTEPSTNLENRKCPVHKKILEYYCTEDNTCICVSCSLAGEHRGHRVEMLDEASEKKKKKLRNVLQKLITKREKTEERVRNLEEHRRKAEKKASGEAERVTALFIDIRRWLDDLEKRVRSEISRQEESISLSSSALIQQLEIKKDELSRKMRHIEELCGRVDPLTVLQDPGDLYDTEGERGDDDTGGHDKTHDVDVDVITEMLHAGFSNIMTYLPTISPAKSKNTFPRHCPNFQSLTRKQQALPMPSTEYWGKKVVVKTGGVRQKVIAPGESRIYGEGPADIFLDINTASAYTFVSADLKTAAYSLRLENRPETLERFETFQVMSREIFTSGRHYWDVESDRSGACWRVGMCYPSIDRKGDKLFIGNNNKSWCLCGGLVFNTHYSVQHDNKAIQLNYKYSSDRVRICLDYEAGLLSFYELCDPIRHLHTYTATFTEPLHAVLYVYEGSVTILTKQ